MADCNAPKRIFLRKILYRIDFQLITEKMQEELFQYVAEKYNPYFSNQGNEQENSVDIEINPLTPGAPKMNTSLQNVFVLTHSRLSQEDALDGDSNSIVNQKAVLSKCATDNGFSNPVFFIDDGVSGVTFDRPNFNRMIARD